jgi:hypothetical protein
VLFLHLKKVIPKPMNVLAKNFQSISNGIYTTGGTFTDEENVSMRLKFFANNTDKTDKKYLEFSARKFHKKILAPL